MSSTIQLAHSLGMRVVAEGVEDQETWQRLAALDCDLIQGYHLSRPVPPEHAQALLAAKLVRQSPPLRRHIWAAGPV